MDGMRRSLDISPAPARWTEEAFFTFLRRGDSPPHGVALGPMRSVVRNLSGLSDNDLQAMATYFVSLNTPSGAALEPKIARALSPVPPTTDTQRAGHKLYMENCAELPRCARQRAVRSHARHLAYRRHCGNPYRAYNLVLTVLDGIDGSDGLPGNMPGFRDKLSDDDIEALAIYLRASYTTLPLWGLMAERIKSRAQRSCAAALRFVYDPPHAAASAILRPRPRRVRGLASAQTMEFACPAPGTTFVFDSGANIVARGQEGMDCKMEIVGGKPFKVRALLFDNPSADGSDKSAFIEALKPERLWPLAVGKKIEASLQRRRPELEVHPHRRPL